MRSAKRIGIIRDSRGIADNLQTQLENAGFECALIDDLSQPYLAVIDLRACNLMQDSQQAIRLNYDSFRSARAFAHHVGPENGTWVVVQDTGGCFGIQKNIGNRVCLSGLTALCKTANKEWSNITVRNIDIETTSRTSDDIARSLFEELMLGGDDLEIALDQGGLRRTVAYAMDDSPHVLQNHQATTGVLIVTGGARGVTFQCIRALLQKTPQTVVLFGRSMLHNEPSFLHAAQTEAELKRACLTHYQEQGQSLSPLDLNEQVQAVLVNREIRKNLAELTQMGHTVQYRSLDVSDLDALKTVLDDVRLTIGPISGVIHAAGVLSDKRIQDKTDDQFNYVFQTKVQGWLNLLQATANDVLTHLCCFTSVAAKFGNAGQVDYAMSNEILNKTCQYEALRRGSECTVSAINWGPWDGGMVGAELKRHFERSGIDLIPLKEGADAFISCFLRAQTLSAEWIIGVGLQSWFATVESKTTEKIDYWIHEKTYPLFRSHQVWGLPIIPLVAPMAWVYHLAARMLGMPPVLINMLAKKPIKLNRFFHAGNDVYIQYKQTQTGLDFGVGLLSDTDFSFTLTAIPSDSWQTEKAAVSDLPIVRQVAFLEPIFKQKDVYERLFHGRDFQMLQKIWEPSPTHLIGEIKSTFPLDIFVLLDAGLQIGSVGVSSIFNRSALPISIEKIEVFALNECFQNETLYCSVVTLEANAMLQTSNMTFEDQTGRILAKLTTARSMALNGDFKQLEKGMEAESV